MYNPDTRKFENLMGSTSETSLASADTRKFESLMGSSIASHVAAAAAAAAAASTFSVAQPQSGPSEWYNQLYMNNSINKKLSVIEKSYKCFGYTLIQMPTMNFIWILTGETRNRERVR